MRIDVLTIFPELFPSFLSTSLVGRAVEAGRLEVGVHDLRDHSADPHRSVDDEAYGGGGGMVMTAPPWIAAVRALDPDHAARRILLSPQGRRLEERVVRELAAADRLLLLCGRYEGVDERVIELVVDEELSIGDFVLAGGEVAALVVIEALSRQIPGVVGLAESVERDSFRCGWLDHPHYTRPREVEGSAVPPILLSGDHARIERWRRLEALRATLRKRPDLIGGIEREGLDAEERRILAERVKELSGRSGSS
jgi:tRNA (guanine37-N1)-methyltransferase